MIELWTYFLDGSFAGKTNFYENHFDLINSTGGENSLGEAFQIYDAEHAIEILRDLLKPKNRYTNDDEVLFILICYYLYREGYYISELPKLLERPTSLTKSANEVIRSLALEKFGLDENGNVKWANRVQVVDSLRIIRKSGTNLGVNDELNQIFMKISNTNSSFEKMSCDEKLQEIANVIENMLKINGKFIEVDLESNSLNYISNDDVKNIRKLLQCFRHANEESLVMRQNYNKNQKQFLIDYGLTICSLIYVTKKQQLTS